MQLHQARYVITSYLYNILDKSEDLVTDPTNYPIKCVAYSK